VASWRQFADKRLVNRDFARLWYGQAISTVGDYVFDTTLTLWVATKLGAGRPWAPAAVSGLLLAAVIAIVFVGPVAGVWVDRWNHKRTMLGTEAVRAILAGTMALVSLVPQRDLPIPVWLSVIFVLVFLLNSAGQFFNPARQLTIGRVVTGEEEQTKAFGIGNATSAIAGMIGPPLAAPLLFTSGVTWALLLNAASYGVSFLAIRSVELPDEEQGDTRAAVGEQGGEQAGALAGRGFWADFREGLSFLVRDRFVRALLIVAACCQAGTGALNTLDVFFVTGNLHVAAKNYGLLSIGAGVGLIIGSLLAARVVKRFGAARTTAGVLLLAGLVYLLYTRQSTFAAGFVLLLFFEIPIALVNTSISPLFLAAVPERLFGRVMSAFGMVNQGTQMLSMIVAGWLASSSLRNFHTRLLGVHLGPIDTILSVGALLIVLGGLNAFRTLPRNMRAAAAERARAGAEGTEEAAAA
jgi:MFS family permease